MNNLNESWYGYVKPKYYQNSKFYYTDDFIDPLKTGEWYLQRHYGRC